jgi:bacteriorhodopsin
VLADLLIAGAATFSHFGAMLLFALFVSIALGCLTQRTVRDWTRYVLRSFTMFVVIGVVVVWLMYPISR